MHRLGAVAVVVLMLSTLLLGQSSITSLRGTVSDPQGAVLLDATVTLSNPGTGFSESKMTDRDGAYQFLELPPGTYTLTVTKTGFATLKEDNLPLLVNVPATSNISTRVKGEVSIVEFTRLCFLDFARTVALMFSHKKLARLSVFAEDSTSEFSSSDQDFRPFNSCAKL